MNKIICIICCVLTFLACKQKLGEYYFDYDAVDYYSIEYDEFKLLAQKEKPNLNGSQKTIMDVLLDDTPKSETDTSFINNLIKSGFEKMSIKDSIKVGELNNLFREKTHKESSVTACLAVYRDVLIFRKQGAVIGTAKICFDCSQSIIHGTKVNTSKFGQSGDYGKLYQILSE